MEFAELHRRPAKDVVKTMRSAWGVLEFDVKQEQHTNHNGDQLSQRKAAAVPDSAAVRVETRQRKEVIPCPGRLNFAIIPSQELPHNTTLTAFTLCRARQ